MDFEQDLANLADDGLLITHCLDFFGQPSDDSPYLAAAIKQYDHGNGDVDFDAAPVVSRTMSGAYVSAWVWVEDYDLRYTWLEKKNVSDFKSALEALTLRGLTVRECLDYFGKQCVGSPYIERAREYYLYVLPGLLRSKGNKYAFDEFPVVSESENGAYVSAWLWVSNHGVLPTDASMDNIPELPDRRVLSQRIVDEYRCPHTVDCFTRTPLCIPTGNMNGHGVGLQPEENEMTRPETPLLTITFFEGEYTSDDSSLAQICKIEGSVTPEDRRPFETLEETVRLLEMCAEKYAVPCLTGERLTAFIHRKSGANIASLVRIDVIARNGRATAAVLGEGVSREDAEVDYSADDDVIAIILKILEQLIFRD